MPTQKIMCYSLADLCADLSGMSAALTQACRQPSGPYRVRGLVQLGDRILFLLLPRASAPAESYVFADVCDVSEEDLIGVLNERWAAGFDCVGSVSAGDGLSVLLFSRPESPA